MKKLMLWMVALALLAGVAARAQDLTGIWQGTLKASKDLRMILVVSKEDGRLQAKLLLTRRHNRSGFRRFRRIAGMSEVT